MTPITLLYVHLYSAKRASFGKIMTLYAYKQFSRQKYLMFCSVGPPKEGAKLTFLGIRRKIHKLE